MSQKEPTATWRRAGSVLSLLAVEGYPLRSPHLSLLNMPWLFECKNSAQETARQSQVRTPQAKSRITKDPAPLRVHTQCSAQAPQASLAHAQKATGRNDEVIDEIHVQRPARLCQPARQRHVLRAWRDVAGRMVMAHQDSSAVAPDRLPEHLARPDTRAVERALVERLLGQHLVARVQE